VEFPALERAASISSTPLHAAQFPVPPLPFSFFLPFGIPFSYFIYIGDFMYTKQCGKWIVDLENLTCRNTENELVIVFERRGMMLMGTIKNMPIRLVQKWTQDPNCKADIRKALVEADEVFFKAYFASEIADRHSDLSLSA
jgi:hypothetical protein